MAEIEDLFGIGEQKPDAKVSLAVFLRYLASLLDEPEQETQEIDGRATEPEEVRVRPRIEPLGGS